MILIRVAIHQWWVVVVCIDPSSLAGTHSVDDFGGNEGNWKDKHSFSGFTTFAYFVRFYTKRAMFRTFRILCPLEFRETSPCCNKSKLIMVRGFVRLIILLK